MVPVAVGKRKTAHRNVIAGSVGREIDLLRTIEPNHAHLAVGSATPAENRHCSRAGGGSWPDPDRDRERTVTAREIGRNRLVVGCKEDISGQTRRTTVGSCGYRFHRCRLIGVHERKSRRRSVKAKISRVVERIPRDEPCTCARTAERERPRVHREIRDGRRSAAKRKRVVRAVLCERDIPAANDAVEYRRAGRCRRTNRHPGFPARRFDPAGERIAGKLIDRKTVCVDDERSRRHRLHVAKRRVETGGRSFLFEFGDVRRRQTARNETEVVHETGVGVGASRPPPGASGHIADVEILFLRIAIPYAPGVVFIPVDVETHIITRLRISAVGHGDMMPLPVAEIAGNRRLVIAPAGNQEILSLAVVEA